MTAVEYRQVPNRVQLRAIPAAFRLGHEAGTVARRRDLSADPVIWAIGFLPRPAPQRHVRLVLVLARDRDHCSR